MAYRETMENNGMEAGRAKNQIPYCTVVLVALNVILFLIGLDPAQSRRMDGIRGLLQRGVSSL